MPARPLVADVQPAWPYRLPRGRGPDLVSRVVDGVWERFLHIDGAPVLARAWERPRERTVRIAAIPVEPEWVLRPRGEYRPRSGRRPPLAAAPPRRAGRAQLEVALGRVRHAIALDDDYREMYERFRSDPLLGTAIRRRPELRVRRCIWPWEAFVWAVTEQLIEVERAHAIQRRIAARWAPSIQPPDRRRPLRDVPDPAAIAARAPAELAACGLAPKRALALIKAAREIDAGRADPARAADDRRLTAIANIGPWTVQMLGQRGRGEPDSLPAGDLAYLKLVPHLLSPALDRRATVEEVERFFAPYAPFRGWAGPFLLSGHRRRAASGKPLRYHPPRPELEAA